VIPQEAIVSQTKRPKLELLQPSALDGIVDEAMGILERVGVFVENEEGKKLLEDAGARVDHDQNRVHIPRTVVEECLKTAPDHIQVYDRDGKLKLDLVDDNVHFDPGSAALRIFDPERDEPRDAVTADLIRLARLVEELDHYPAQSTSVLSADVPEEIADRYRLLIALTYGTKPVITGTFAKEAFAVMHRMLAAVRGGKEALREKPLAIFDCCPSPPLKWSDLTCQSLIDCARTGIPAELVSMPLTGATSPVTLAGAVVQHTAEDLSGITIHQLARAGAPIIYGGSPACFDMRKGTAPMGAVETMMIDMAYSQVGKHLGLPTHAYMALSDAKSPDAQAGLESAMGAILAALAGINIVSGPGMLDFESCQSLEKLVLDHEICGMAHRLTRGIALREKPLAEHILEKIGRVDHFLTEEHTMKWFKEEAAFPGPVIDRGTLGEWQADGRPSAAGRAGREVERILSKAEPKLLSEDIRRELEELILADGKKYGLEQLPKRD
jgi:trimethylamine--corrinoid protein Co-methyltransferase